MASCGFSDEDRTGDNPWIVGSWPIKIMQSQPSIVSSANQTACDFRDKISINRCSSLFLTQLSIEL